MKKIIFTILMLCFVCTTWADIVAGKTYRISSTVDNRSMFVKNASLDINTDVVVWTETNVPAQQWEAIVNSDGTFSFKNVYTGMYLMRKSTLTTSATLVQNSASTIAASCWNVAAVDGQTNCYTLSQTSGTTTLYVSSASAADGTALQMAAAKTGTDANQEIWKIEEVTPITSLTEDVRDIAMTGWLDQFLKSRNSEGTQKTLGNGGGWGDAEMLETLLDAYEATGNSEYLNTFTNVFSYFYAKVGADWLKLVYNDEYKWYGHDFNDDVMWMIIASIRAYKLTGSVIYRTYAKNNFNAIYSRAYDAWGMLRWAQDSGGPNGTNSCINGPAEVAACYIGSAFGDESYFTKARDLYEKQRRYLFNSATGQVYDSFTWDANTNQPSGYNRWSSTYNQGTMLGAAVMLYEHYGDEMYKEDAEKIVDYTRKNLCNTSGVINVCQTVDGDLCGFKGILMRYLRKYVVSLNHPEDVEWLQRNAMHAYNNKNSSDVISSAWLTKSSEDFKITEGTTEKDFSGQPFGCSTAISALFNAPLSIDNIAKDAYSTLEAENFNTMQKIFVTAGETSADRVVSNIKNGCYTVYNNVNFGNRPATGVTFKVSALSVATYNCSIEVHLDSLTGPCVATATIPATSGWKTISASMTPTDGIHNIYLKFVNSSNSSATNCFSVDKFEFTTSTSSMSGDITDNGGSLEASVEADDLNSLTDNRLTTNVTVHGKSASFVYKSVAPAALKGYIVASSSDNADADAKTWQLMGSNDGSTWTVLDTQTGVTFASRCEKKLTGVSTDKTFTYFRLDVTDNNGGSSLKLSEWQLFGSCLVDDAITAEGGTLTPSLPNVVDMNLSTNVELTGNSGVYFIYKSKSKYVLKCYSVTSNADNSNATPVNWTLYASLNNSTWTEIDSQRNQSFPYGNSSQFYKIDNDIAYTYYKLVIESNGGAENTSFAELQLFGRINSSTKLYNDITKNGGVITASDNESEKALQPLIDGDAATTYALPYDGSAWIEYETESAAQLKSYSVCSGYDAAHNPGSWILQGSNDELSWTTIDTRPSASFTSKGFCKITAVTNTAKYKFFRIMFTSISNTSSTELILGDIQLNGLCISDNSLITNSSTTTDAEYVGLSTAENYTSLFDKSAATKYCFNYYATSWIQYNAPSAIKANLYSITSASDDGTRDPKSWKFEGSNDGTTWTVLDTRKDETFYGRLYTQYYGCSNDDAYKYYRLQLTANNGSQLGQFAEWQMFYSDKLVTGIKDITPDVNIDLNVYPNPVVDVLNVTAPSSGLIQVFNVKGQLMTQKRVGAGNAQISFAAFDKGMYLVKVSTGGITKTVKVLK